MYFYRILWLRFIEYGRLLKLYAGYLGVDLLVGAILFANDLFQGYNSTHNLKYIACQLRKVAKL